MALATFLNNDDAVRLLLKVGADVNIQDISGRTALGKAVMQLRRHNADVIKYRLHWQTADVAESIVELLRNAGAVRSSRWRRLLG